MIEISSDVMVMAILLLIAVVAPTVLLSRNQGCHINATIFPRIFCKLISQLDILSLHLQMYSMQTLACLLHRKHPPLRDHQHTHSPVDCPYPVDFVVMFLPQLKSQIL